MQFGEIHLLCNVGMMTEKVVLETYRDYVPRDSLMAAVANGYDADASWPATGV